METPHGLQSQQVREICIAGQEQRRYHGDQAQANEILASREKAGNVDLSAGQAHAVKMTSGANAPNHSHQCHVVTRKYARDASTSR